MKSGFSNIVSNDTEDVEKNVTIFIATFTSEGLKHATRYITHHKTRDIITSEDIKRGMMLEMFLFNNRPNLLDKFEEIKLLINEDEDEDDEDEDEDDESNNIQEKDDEEVAFTENNCECAICKCMNTIYTRWEKYIPTTRLETIIKNNIDIIRLN
jgi:uncharacterized protein YqeY